jgi:hypothetical protein
MNINGTQGFKWIELAKSTFDEIGLSFMYYDQQNGSADWLNTYVKQILRIANRTSCAFTVKSINYWYISPANSFDWEFYIG